MAISIVRIESGTANIQNTDDIRAFNYATSQRNGVVPNYLNECDYEYSGNVFTIKSGEIILDGWQIRIDGNGVPLTLGTSAGVLFYSVYCELTLSAMAKTVEIKASYSTTNYPVIASENDLSVDTIGTARLLLYNFLVRDGNILGVSKKFGLIEGEPLLKRIIYSGSVTSGQEEQIIALSENIEEESTLEVHGFVHYGGVIGVGDSPFVVYTKPTNLGVGAETYTLSHIFAGTVYFTALDLQFSYSSNNAKLNKPCCFSAYCPISVETLSLKGVPNCYVTITKIYKLT